MLKRVRAVKICSIDFYLHVIGKRRDKSIETVASKNRASFVFSSMCFQNLSGVGQANVLFLLHPNVYM